MGCTRAARARSGRRPATAAAVAVSVFGLLAGCTTYHTQDQQARAVAAPAPRANDAPPVGSRAEAMALAARLVANLDLPSGARPAHVRALPEALRQPGIPIGSPHQVDIRRLFAIRRPMSAIQGFLSAHVPGGMGIAGQGSANGPHGADPVQGLNYSLRSLPPGINDAELVITMVPVAGGSLLRADAEAIWYPPRAAAEHLDASGIREVRITGTVSPPMARTAARTITSRRAIARLAGILNSLPAAPSPPVWCPAIFFSYRLTVIPAAPAAPRVVAEPTGCATVGDTVDGAVQPVLWDGGGKLAGAARSLLHLNPPR